MSDGIAKNGDAIICGKVVRALGVRVLKALYEAKRPVIVPQIRELLTEQVSDATLYTTLNRLRDTQGLVVREEESIPVVGGRVRRVTWELTAGAKQFFSTLEQPSIET